MSKAREDGFTLLELLVSLTLLGLLFVLLFGGLRFGMRAWERGTTTGDASEQLQSVQGLLRGEFERICPRRVAASPPADSSPPPPVLQFAGDTGAMRFLAPAPAAAGGQACARIVLAVEPDGALKRLVLHLGATDSGTDLVRGAQAIDFAYLPRGGAWQSGWRGQAMLPALLRLRVTFAAGDARAWPELFVAPRISADTDCTYDAATKSCRGS